MAFPSKPEPAKNGWINRSIERFKAWAYSRQPIPNQQDFDVTEGADGVRFSIKKKLLPPEPKREHRQFHIEAAGSKKLRVFNGTLFGQLPTGFSANDDPVFEITARVDLSPLQSGDKVYAKVTWNRTVSAFGDIVSTITTRTVEAAATVPTNDYLTATRHYLLATITLPASNIPVVSQSRWGPIDDLPGTATNPYLMPPSPGTQTTAQTDYWNLTETGKGKDTGAANLAPTYDSVTFNKSGFVRFVNDDGNLKAFLRAVTINSLGAITIAPAETLAFQHVQIDVLVSVRIYSGQLQGQYKKAWVMTSAASSPEWVNLLPALPSAVTACP
jgi:hypothetical protein